MKNLKLIAPLLLLSLAACTDMKSQVTEAYYSVKEAVPAVGDSLSNKPTAQRLVDAGKCPRVEIEPDLSTLHEFGNAPRATAAAALSSVTMTQLNSCSYGPKSVTVDVELTFTGAPGQAVRGSGGQFVYPYFVAVVAPGGKILAKDTFAISLAYPPGGAPQTHVETIRQIVPSLSQANGAAHKIMIGFQLSDQQLAFNKNNRVQHEQSIKAAEQRQKEFCRANPDRAALTPACLTPASGSSTSSTSDIPKSKLNN